MQQLDVPADRILEEATRIADLLLELGAQLRGARDAALLRVPHREQHERREQRIADECERRQPG